MVSRMSRRQWLAIGGFVVVAVLLIAATAGRLRQPAAVATTPGATESALESASPAIIVEPTSIPTPSPIATASPTPSPTPTATPGPTPEPTPTDPPLAGGDPRLLYAEFMLRVNDDRSTVEALNEKLGTAAQAQDADAVRAASVDILDFVDTERDWLRDHPPGKCYATAHKAARAMIAAYGDAAERFFDWSESGGGLAGLDALGKALEAAQVAGDKLNAFGSALEETSCPG